MSIKTWFILHLASYFCNCEAKSIPRIMKDNSTKTAQLVASAYEEYFDKVYRYIYFKINNREEAEDLAQDVFVRLMNYNQIICTDTIKFFIFTIARNLLNDFLRRHYKKQEITSYIYEHAITHTIETESEVIANDLQAHEQYRLSLLPTQRRTIYSMNRFDNKNILEISTELNLSPRTVENHLFMGRKEIREYISRCI